MAARTASSSPPPHASSVDLHWQIALRAAEAYERHLVPLFFEPAAGFLLDAAGVGPGDRVLDLACGTGVVAREASRRVGPTGAVLGLDRNAAMLEVAREACRRAATPSIEWHHGRAEELPFPDASIDVICCQQGLQFFVDRGAAANEMRRVLAPGGRAAASVLRGVEHNPGYRILSDVLEQHVAADVAEAMRSPFAPFRADDLRELFAHAGFDRVGVRIGLGPVRYPSAREFFVREAASSPFAERIEALDSDVLEALVRDLEAALTAYTDDDGVVFPAETHLVVAHA